MKKYASLALLPFLFVSCSKTINIVNNDPPSAHPTYTVQGISDVTLSQESTYNLLDFTVDYGEGAQERVNLELSALPAGIDISDSWLKSGYPKFSSRITFFDSNSLNSAVPSTYPMTLTASTATGGSKMFNFNIIVKDIPACTNNLVGGYPNCNNITTNVNYVDSVYADPLQTNKLWFRNFGNTGRTVCGIVYCSNNRVLIPFQVVDGMRFSGQTYTAVSPYKMSFVCIIEGVSVRFKM